MGGTFVTLGWGVGEGAGMGVGGGAGSGIGAGVGTGDCAGGFCWPVGVEETASTKDKTIQIQDIL